MGDKDQATQKASIASRLPKLSYIGSNQRESFCTDPEGLSPPAQCLIPPPHPISAPCIDEKQPGTKKRGIFRAFSFTLHRRRLSFGQLSRDSGNRNECRSLHDSSESSKDFSANGTHSYHSNKNWNSKNTWVPQRQQGIASGSTRRSSLKRESLLALGPFWGCLQQSRSEDNDDDLPKSVPDSKVTATQISRNINDGSCDASSFSVSNEGRLGPVKETLNCKASMENVCEVWSLKSRSSGDYENVIIVPQTHHQDKNEPLIQIDGANTVQELDTMLDTASKTNPLHLVANGNESNQPCKQKVTDIVKHAAGQEMFNIEDADTVTETPEVDLETVSFSDIEKDIGFPSLALQQSDCDMQGSVDALPSIPESPESSHSIDSALMEDFLRGESREPEVEAETDTLIWNAIVLPQGQEQHTKLTSVPSSPMKLESFPDEVALAVNESSWSTCRLKVSDNKDMAATVKLPTTQSGMDCSEQIGGIGTEDIKKCQQFENSDSGEQKGCVQNEVNVNTQAYLDEEKQKEEEVKRIRAASFASSGVNSMDLVLSMGSLELDEDDLMLTVDMSEACKPSATHVLKGARSGLTEAEYRVASSEERKEERTVCFVPVGTGIVHGEKQENPQRISSYRVQTGAVLRNSSICETGRRTGGISPAVSHRTSPQNLRDVAWSSEEVLASSEPTLLRQASAECTGLKTLLLRLRRLLQEEADANVTFSTLPNSDGAAAINQALLLGEISRLNERVREQDKIICKMQQQLDERGLQGTILGCDGRVERACQTDDATSSIYPFQVHRWPSSLERRGLGLAYMATSPSVALNDKQSRTNQRVNNSSPIVLPSPPTPPSSLCNNAHCENANVHACDCKRLNRECSEMLTSVGSEKMFPRPGSPANRDVPAVSLHGLAATPNDTILHSHESDSILHLKHIFECCSITNNDMGPLPASSPTIKRSTASCKRHSVEAITQGLKSNVEWNSSPHRPPLQCPCDLMSISDDMTVVIQV